MISRVAGSSGESSHARELRSGSAGEFGEKFFKGERRLPVSAGLTGPGTTDGDCLRPDNFLQGPGRPGSVADGCSSIAGFDEKVTGASSLNVEKVAWCTQGRHAAIGCTMEVAGARVEVIVAAARGAMSVMLTSDGRMPPATLKLAADAVRRSYPGASVAYREGKRR